MNISGGEPDPVLSEQTGGKEAIPQAPKNKGGNKGNGGGGNGGNNGGGNSNRKPAKKPSVPDGCCDNHKKWAGEAWFCLEPTKCPMKDQNKPRPEKKNNNN